MTDEPVGVPAEQTTQPWVRSSRDARFGGVCSGIARRQRLDPVLVRVLFVLLSLSAGLGIVLYAAAFAFWPDDRGGRAPIEQWLPQTRTWTTQRKWVATAIVALLGMSTIGTASPFTLGPVLVLVVAWRIARRQAGRPAAVVREEAPVLPQARLSPEFDAATLAWQRRMGALDGRWTPGAPTPAHLAAPSYFPAPVYPGFVAQADPLGIYAPAEDPRGVAHRSRPRFRITLLVLLIAAGAAGLGYTVPQADDAWRLAVASALGVIAVALLIGARRGRPRLLVFVGLILASASFLPGGPVGEAYSGEVHKSYTNGNLPPDFTVVFADGVLDLSGLTVTTPITLPVMCAASSLEIRLPAGVSTTIQHEQVATTLVVPGSAPITGSGRWTSAGVAGPPTLSLSLEAIGCEVTVT